MGISDGLIIITDIKMINSLRNLIVGGAAIFAAIRQKTIKKNIGVIMNNPLFVSILRLFF